MKKTICLLLSAVFVLMFSSLCVFAEGDNSDSQKKRLTVFGDSISAGYSLDDYIKDDVYHSKKCFASIIADKLGDVPNEEYFNFSYPGWTSSQILSSVKSADTEIVKNSDYILVSAGANEIIDIIEETIYGVFSDDPTVAQKYSGALSKVNSSNLISVFVSGGSDPEVKELLDYFIEKCTDENASKKYNQALDKYEKNIKEMVSYIRSTGSKADIVLLLPYNPGAVISGNKLIDKIQETLSDMRDRAVALSKSTTDGSVRTIDLIDSFDGRYPLVTFILSGDIHPNETGHSEIARLICEELGIKDDKSDSSKEEVSSGKETSENKDESSAEENYGSKEPPVSNVVVYVVLGIAAVLVVCIVTHFIITHRKK